MVLTVDRFSKATHFILLPKLPSDRETVVAVIDHDGLPTDVVSDRGPQFVSQFWKEFCGLLGANVSLSSGFHPQSNGQTEWAKAQADRHSSKPPVYVIGQKVWISSTDIPLRSVCKKLAPN